MIDHAARRKVRVGFSVRQCVGFVLVRTVEDFAFAVHPDNVAAWRKDARASEPSCSFGSLGGRDAAPTPD